MGSAPSLQPLGTFRPHFPWEVRDSVRVVPASVAASFWRFVQPMGSCWIWRGITIKGPKGEHGFFMINGQQVPVDRAGFMIAHGAIPEDWKLYSSCRRPSCVNPDHHSLGPLKRNGEPAGK